MDDQAPQLAQPPQPDNPGSFIIAQARQAQAAAFKDIDADPEQAARSIELSNSTGIPAALVDINQEQIEKQHKAAMVAEFLRNNPHLQDYVNSHPLAAKVSANDWGQLDAISQALVKFHHSPFGQALDAPTSILGAGAKGFKEGMEQGGQYGEWIDPKWGLLPLPRAELAALGYPAELTTHIFSGITEGVKQAAAQGYTSFGGSPGNAESFGNEVAGIAEAELMGMSGRHGVEAPTMPQAMAQRVTEAFRAAKPYLLEGKVPPVGTHPLLDRIHVEQAKLDSKNLGDLGSEIDKSQTKTIAPDFFNENFLKRNLPDTIGISDSGIEKLYGKDGLAEPGDNKLGWAPNINDQINLARATGGDVEVPLADFLTKVDPELRKELDEHLRVRPDGVTLEEGRELGKVEEPKTETVPEGEEVAPAPEVTPVDSIRRAAKLEAPSFDALAQTEGKPAIIDSKWRVLRTELGNVTNVSYLAPTERFTEKEQAIATAVRGYLQQIAPDISGRTLPARRVRIGRPGYEVQAAYQPMQDSLPIILYSLYGPEGKLRLPDEILSSVRHETMHHLFRGGLLTNEEWETLQEAAHRENWMDKYHIHTRYEGANEELKVEEAIAEEFAHWNIKPEATHIAAHVFQKLRDILLHIRDIVIEKFGFDPKVEDLFHRIESGEVGTREERTPRPKGLLAEQREEEPELPGMTRLEDRPLFEKAAAIGMTKGQMERYQALIAKRREEDAAHQAKIAERRVAEQQTKEWKENYAGVREQAAKDVRSRPDISADLLFRNGELYGEKVRRPKLDSSQLTPEQRAAIPKDYLAGEGGIHPDDAAGLFGYQSGDALVEGLARLHAEREREGLTPQAHLTRLTDVEAERVMRRDYGSLEQSILDEAKDHVISSTQLDMLHEELLALGTHAKAEMPIGKDDIKGWVKEQFRQLTVGAHSTDKYLAQAGRAGADAEKALLEGSPADAFKAKQQQYMSLLLANEAKKLEKEKAGFDRTAKRFSRREVAGLPAEYTNWVHDILQRTGNLVRRSVQDLQEAISRESATTLEEFTRRRNEDSRVWESDENMPSDFQRMPVASFLFDPSYRKPIAEMSVDEFRAVNNSIKTLIKNGRDENKVLVSGEKADLNNVVDAMTSRMQEIFGDKKNVPIAGEKKGFIHGIKTYFASLLQVESIFNRLDRSDPKGIFFKTLTGPLFEASNTLATKEREYSRLYKQLKFDPREMKRKVSNSLFIDPITGDPMAMNRGHLMAVLQNVGNPSQLDKLARGYKIEDPAAIMRWVFANTTKEDWDRAQALGDIFERAFEEASGMYHELSGVAPEKIDIRAIQTPFGEYKGWYHPVIYDPDRPGASKKLMGPGVLDDGSYYRAAAPSGYTKKRTGYAAPILLSLDLVPAKLRQILNDTAMRPAVSEAAKVFYDPRWQMGMTKAMGKEVKDLFIPYLKDVAGQKMYKDAAQTTALRVLEAARQNIIATLIGLNPSTVMKHGPTAAMLSMNEVGYLPFLRELKGLLSFNDELGERNYSFAMRGGEVNGERWNGSEELQRRHRNWQETLTGAQADVFGENTLRNTVIKFGATPVALSDLISAVPTWLAAYKAQIRAGETHGAAASFADRAVRRAHGSSAITARPRIMRGGPLAQFATPFYTFFNEMFQRQYEMAWRAKEMLGQFSEGEYRAGAKQVPFLASGLWAYVVFPALVEQMVSPVLTGNQSETTKVLGWGARTVGSSLPVVRDIIEAFLSGRDPTIGLYSTGGQAIVDVAKDAQRKQLSMDNAHAGKTIKHAITLFGAATGLTNAQEGRTGEFAYDYMTGRQRPKTLGDVMRGLWHGQMKEPKR